MYVDETKKLKVFNISSTSNKQKTNNFLHYSRKFWKFLILKNLSNMMETNETDLCVSGGYRFSRLCTYRGIMTESGTGACHDCHSVRSVLSHPDAGKTSTNPLLLRQSCLWKNKDRDIFLKIWSHREIYGPSTGVALHQNPIVFIE